MDFNQYRRSNGTIRLVDALKDTDWYRYVDKTYNAIAYLETVELIHPINSRQAAAVALAMAIHFNDGRE